DLGERLGELDAALAPFDHPAIHRDFYWDLAGGRAIVDRWRHLVADAETARAIDRLTAEFDRHTAPSIDALPRAAIHGDGHADNVLVSDDGDVESRGQRV